MRSKFTKQQKLDMIMECRSSGLSDYMWCKNHDICSSTFYSWIKQLRHDGIDVPERAHAEEYHFDSRPDIVKLEIAEELPCETVSAIQRPSSADCMIEIAIGRASVKVFHDVDPKLLSQVMHCLGGCL